MFPRALVYGSRDFRRGEQLEERLSRAHRAPRARRRYCAKRILIIELVLWTTILLQTWKKGWRG